MKAMLLHKAAPIENSPLVPADIEAPQPQLGEVLIKVEACGLCHTDLHTIEGELKLPKLPLIPGHQVVGKVVKLGRQVERFGIGDRLGLAWLGYTCQDCDFCREGNENLCEQAQFTGLHFDGGYAEYVVARADFAYPVPDNVSAVSAAPLLCAGIIGYRALRLSGIRPGDLLGLYGFGASAHIAIQIARHWGCRVYVFSRGEQHRELARRLGAVWTGKIDEPVPEKLHGGVIFAPAGSLVPPALAHLEKGGTLALAGIYMSDIPPLNYDRHLYHEKNLRSVANSTRRDGMELMRLAGEIGIATTVQEFPLEQVNQALQQLKAGKVNGAAVLKFEN